jgi:hypothetical protein
VTPRRRSWIALVVFFLAVPLAANLPLAAGLLVLLLALIGYGVFQATLRCPRCGSLLVRRRVAGITVYAPLAPRSCAKCGLDLDFPAGGAQAQTSEDPHG